MSRWPALALVTLAHALGPFAILSVAPLAPFLVEGLALSRAEIGLLLPAVYLGGVVMALPAGWLTDRLGVRPTLALGQLLIGAMMALAALSGRLPIFLACLLAGGFGFSVLNPATGRAIVEWFPPRQRGVAMGIKQTGLTLGGVAASLALPPLALAAGWRRALAAAAAVALLSALLVAVAYRSPAAPAFAAAAERPRLGEIRVFLRRWGVRVVLACGLALSIAQSSLLTYFVLHATEIYLVSAVNAARLLALAQVGGAASRLGWGIVSDRWLGGRRRPGVVASALIGAVACGLLAAGDRVPHALVIPLAVLAGVGVFGWVGLYFALVAEIGGARYAGLLTGVATMCAWSGVLVGPPLFGLALAATGAYTVPWLVLGALALLVAMALVRLQPLVQRDPT